MDWSNERYVRLYTRDTVTWKLLDWRARAVLMFMIRKVDRAGVIDVGADGARGLAALLELPMEVVAPALEQLTRGDDPTVKATGSAFVLPRFIEAQEAAQSDGQRQRELRARRRDIAMMAVSVTKRDGCEQALIGAESKRLAESTSLPLESDDLVLAPSRNVTVGHEINHDRHVVSRRVTPSLASIRIGIAGSDSPLVPIEREINNIRRNRKRGRTEPTSEELAITTRVLGKLGEHSGVAYSGAAAHVRAIVGRLREGITEWQLRAVVAYCADEWKSDEKMRRYLRPETLFGAESIARYLDPACTRYADLIARFTPPAAQPALPMTDEEAR